MLFGVWRRRIAMEVRDFAVMVTFIVIFLKVEPWFTLRVLLLLVSFLLLDMDEQPLEKTTVELSVLSSIQRRQTLNRR